MVFKIKNQISRLVKKCLAMSYFEKYLDKINYVGVDISNEVDVAAQRFVKKILKLDLFNMILQRCLLKTITIT